MTDMTNYATIKLKTLDHRLLWFRKWLVRAKKEGLTQQGWERLFGTLDSMIDHAAMLERATHEK